jgi:hypothetical protein
MLALNHLLAGVQMIQPHSAALHPFQLTFSNYYNKQHST